MSLKTIIKERIEGIERSRNTVLNSEIYQTFLDGKVDAFNSVLNILAGVASFNEYQKFTKTTAIYPKEGAVEYCTLGLLSEAGEVAGKVKKAIRDNNSDFSDEEIKKGIQKEISDCYWYLARIQDELGLQTSDTINMNMEKLNSRKDRGVIGGSGDNR